MLHLLLIIPIITCLLIVYAIKPGTIRLFSLIGAGIQLILSFYLVVAYYLASNNITTLLFESDFTWFKAFNIHYHTAIDGISVSMILLTALISFTGILASWNITDRPK